MKEEIKLTAYSHGAGCGCKLSPGILSKILGTQSDGPTFPGLLVGNETKDDAAVFNLDGKTAIISTTDFFMPIVDDPFEFGAIAATNAISDIYAMGGEPIMAIAILGWPIDKLPPDIASKVLEGGKYVCNKAGIPLAGGHSIDCPEPIFGLAVTGKVEVKNIKKNNKAKAGDLLFLTKPLGIGLVTTAQKKNLVKKEDLVIAKESMLTLNDIGRKMAAFSYVHSLTDVTGFGIAGHLLEMCEGSTVSAEIQFNKLPIFSFVNDYINLGCIPGGTIRNWKTYGDKIQTSHEDQFKILADPQTSGGLLVAIDPHYEDEFSSFLMQENHQQVYKIGRLVESDQTNSKINVL